MSKIECFECGHLVEPRIEERTETLPVRGEATKVRAQVAVCPECGADMSVEELDDATLVAAFNAYRQKHGLMTPDRMRELRKEYGLSVRAFSLLLGWGEVTLHRYESGSLQDDAHEATLRLAEDPANVKTLLIANRHKLTARQRQQLETRLRTIEDETHASNEMSCAEPAMIREQQDVYSGWVLMRLSKLREMVLFFAQLPNMYETKLNKLLFYADFKHYEQHSVSVSGSPYLAFPYGPVPRDCPRLEADLLECGDLAAEEVFFSDEVSGTVFKASREPDLTVFTEEELATLRDIANRLGHRTSKELSDLSHQERAWKETPQRKMISYELASSLRI